MCSLVQGQKSAELIHDLSIVDLSYSAVKPVPSGAGCKARKNVSRFTLKSIYPSLSPLAIIKLTDPSGRRGKRPVELPSFEGAMKRESFAFRRERFNLHAYSILSLLCRWS
jgi:hypothetical protein